MKRATAGCLTALLATLLLPAVTAQGQDPQSGTLIQSMTVLQEIQRMPAQSIPTGLLNKARAVVIIPNMIKVGFIGSVRHGSGVAVVRNPDGTWGNPIFMSMTGGGVGFQVGVQAADVILVFNNTESVNSMLRGKFTLGVDAAAAAGPVGRRAEAATDITFRAAILSYSRSRGLFAGVALDGAVLSVDNAANATFYRVPGGNPAAIMSAQNLVLPPAAAEMKAVLAAQSGAPISAPPIVPTPATGAIPGPAVAQPQPAVVPPQVQLDPVQNQLTSAAAQLAARLDDRWRNYLALPPEVGNPQTRPTAVALGQTLEHFNRVEHDPSFAMIAQLPEFRTTHELLRKYYSTVQGVPAAQASPVVPPLPAGTGAAPQPERRY